VPGLRLCSQRCVCVAARFSCCVQVTMPTAAGHVRRPRTWRLSCRRSAPLWLAWSSAWSAGSSR
jgi:hypothetical protein